MSSEDQVERLARVEARTYHTDGEVSALKTQVAGVVDTLQRIEAAILNKPPIWNSSSVIALLAIVGSTFWGITSYVDVSAQKSQWRVDSLVEQVAAEEKKQETLHEINTDHQKQVHYEVGVMKTKFEAQDRYNVSNENKHDVLISRVGSLEAIILSLEATLSGVNTKLDQIDNYGSRKWIRSGVDD